MHDLHINYCKTSGKQFSQIYQSLMENRESVSTISRLTLETPRSQGRLLPCSNMAQFTSTDGKNFPHQVVMIGMMRCFQVATSQTETNYYKFYVTFP